MIHFLKLRYDVLEKINIILLDDLYRTYYFYSDDINIETFLRKILKVKIGKNDNIKITNIFPDAFLLNLKVNNFFIKTDIIFCLDCTEEELFYFKMKYGE